MDPITTALGEVYQFVVRHGAIGLAENGLLVRGAAECLRTGTTARAASSRPENVRRV